MTPAGSPPPDASPPTVEDEGGADSGVDSASWPGCAATAAALCDDFEGSNLDAWPTQLVPEGGALQVVSGVDAPSPSRYLTTQLGSPTQGSQLLGARVARAFPQVTGVDYSAHVRVARRSPGRIYLHELVAPSSKWRLAVELSSSGDKLVEETGTGRRTTPLSRSLPDNVWARLRLQVQLRSSPSDAVLTLDGVEVCRHRAQPPGVEQVNVYAGHRAVSDEGGNSIVDVDNVVFRVD